ncbi:MAG: VWA domain-containing protein [Desulfobacteraceae bacterium]
MRSIIYFRLLKISIFFLFILFSGWCSTLAAEFTADLIITSPDSEIVYDLIVKDNMYRIQKVKGLDYMPPFPTIHNRSTEISWGLNPQTKQYVEQTDPSKTIMTNPIVGWKFMRKDLEVTAAGEEIIQGYSCKVFEFRQKGESRVVNRIWVASELGFALKEVSYAANGDSTMILQNIKKNHVAPELFKIPAGYTRVTMEEPAKKNSVEKSAPAPSNIVFILDASGSMWGQVEGTAKIVIAKEVLSDLIRDLPDESIVGLVAYGHRRKGDCNDVEELIALGPLDKKVMINRIQELNAKGKTPISRSVRLTGERIKHLEDETTIILISDGKETCDPDPCGLVKDLKGAGIKFIMHVIGFDVTEEEKIQLECMAKAGGGKYFTAENAGDFSTAAREVVKKQPPTYGILRILVTKNDKPFFTAVTLTNLETKKIFSPVSSSGKTGIAEINLAPGKYTAQLKDSSVSGGKTPIVKLTDINIVAGETVEKKADFSDGSLVLTTLRNGEPFIGHVFYFRQGENKSFRNENTQPETGRIKRKLLPGVYRIEVKTESIATKPVVTIDPVEILPGSTVEKKAEFFSGEVLVKSSLNGKPKHAPFKIFNASRKEVYRSWTAGPPEGQRLVRLPAGTYKIEITTLIDNSTKTFENVNVQKGQSQTLEANFDFGELAIAAKRNGKPFSTPFYIFNSEGKQVRRGWTQNGERKEKLAEGTYRVQVTNIKDQKQIIEFENIVIVSRELKTVTAEFPVQGK